jgi:hypothetical protein
MKFEPFDGTDDYNAVLGIDYHGGATYCRSLPHVYRPGQKLNRNVNCMPRSGRVEVTCLKKRCVVQNALSYYANRMISGTELRVNRAAYTGLHTAVGAT